MKAITIILMTLFGLLFWMAPVDAATRAEGEKELCDYVLPLVGTQGEGNTYPGAVAPFGMIQISPDTDKKNWGAASGYEYSDDSIIGFSLTHLNGTGIPDLGDILFVPAVGTPKFQPGTKKDPDSGYRCRFSHDNEEASPGYYSVRLTEPDVQVEMTAADRSGILRFTFPQSNQSHIVTDLAHVLQWKITWSRLRVENKTLITGYHVVEGWGRERYVYFAARYSRPFDQYGIMKDGKIVQYDTKRFRSSSESWGKNLQFFARYATKQDETISVKVGISAVSTANALENLDSEIPHWDFSKVRNQTREKWNKELSKIQIEGSQKTKETFYSSVYHAFLTPTLYEDVNGQYRGLDQNIHQSKDFTNYGVFSLWDTYRATHPLFVLLQPERNAQMINAMLAHYDQSVDHLLPVWSLNSNETWCMIGYHGVSVIADAFLKGVKGFDAGRAYEAVKRTAMNPDYDSVAVYDKLGWVPFDQENEAVSKTLEYAYDDFCVAKMAEALGKKEDYKYFMRRARHYKNLFDKTTGFMRGRDSKGNWRTPFAPDYFEYWGDFTEGTSWQYTWYVPHDVQGLVNLMGGPQKFSARLDQLYRQTKEQKQKGVEDIHGRIGMYWHGNEPSHHIAFLYNYVGQPWKTQKLIRRIMKTQYGNTPSSLCGNDDCGQMSAWYIFNAMGFYPVCPGADYYVIGSPSVKKTVMRLADNKTFTVETKKLSDKNIYIQSVKLNGKKWNKTYIPFSEIIGGGTLQFKMGPTPNKKWGVNKDSVPPSLSEIAQ